MEQILDYTQWPILLVDDKLENLQSVRKILAHYFTVDTAGSGPEALDMLQKKKYAVIISDQKMEPMCGIDLLARVAELYPLTIRILITGYTDYEAAVNAINKGQVYRYIGKDGKVIEELPAMIRQALDYYWERMERMKLQAVMKQYREKILEVRVKHEDMNKDVYAVTVKKYDHYQRHAAALFFQQCYAFLQTPTHQGVSAFFSQENPDRLKYWYRIYDEVYAYYDVEKLFEKKIPDEQRLNDLMSNIVDQKIMRFQLEKIVTTYILDSETVFDLVRCFYTHDSWNEMGQLYIYNNKRLGIIQEQPECVSYKISPRLPAHDRIILETLSVPDAENIKGSIVDAVHYDKYKWWYNDGSAVTPETFFKEFLARVQNG